MEFLELLKLGLSGIALLGGIGLFLVLDWH